jgi:hypothetical protein
MFSDFKFDDFLMKLKGGDIKTIAITSITLLCLALSYMIIAGNGDNSTAEETTEVKVEEEEIVLRDFTIDQLVSYIFTYICGCMDIRTYIHMYTDR